MIGWLLPMVSLNYPNVISRMKELFRESRYIKRSNLGIGKGLLYPTVKSSPYENLLSKRECNKNMERFTQILIDEFC